MEVVGEVSENCNKGAGHCMIGVNPADLSRAQNGNTTIDEVNMSYRSILVQVDDNDQSDRRISVAARLARMHDADLHGIYVTPAREMTPFTSAMLPDSVVENRLRETGEAQARAEKRFRACAAAEQLATVTWSAPAGPALEAAVANLRRADIAVAGQPLPGDPDAGFAGDILYGMLMQAGRPLLIVPHYGDFTAVGRNVLIAWKETRESARAVSDALPFLKRADQVVVMPVASTGDSYSGDARSGAGVADYLTRHGVTARIRAEVADDIDVGNLLLSRASDLATDLIVMGGYSRTRLAERVSGGVTRLILQSMTVPVLMSH